MKLSPPTAAEIADAMRTAELGGDLRDLARVANHQAPRFRGTPEGETRLLRAAAALTLAADVLDHLADEDAAGSR
jgi:hypothetical protein